MVRQRWSDNMTIIITNFNVKSFEDKLSASCKGSKCSRTMFTSLTSFYFGRAGLVLNVPFKNRETSGWLPKDLFLCSTMTLDNALLAVFKAL